MYRFVGEKKGKEPLPGISLECESDEDFERYCTAAGQNPAAVKASGLYEHVKPKSEAPTRPSVEGQEEE